MKVERLLLGSDLSTTLSSACQVRVDSDVTRLQYTFCSRMSLCLGPLASCCISRTNIPLTIAFGGILAFLGFVLSAFSPNIYGIFVSFGVVCGKPLQI